MSHVSREYIRGDELWDTRDTAKIHSRMYFEEEQAMKKLFDWMQSKRQARAEVPAEADSSIMPDEKDAQAGRERLEADVAEVRARHKREPLQYPDGPDWFAFCHAYPEGCDDCPYYRPKLACWCRLWEACFPGVVRWWSWDEAMQQVEATEGKR